MRHPNIMIIFEDAYENEPGVTVPRSSTDTEVEFYVYGGTNGGTYAFSIVNGGKLNRIGGGRLPKTGSIAAGKSFTYKVRYEAMEASGSEDDIIAKAEFMEFGTGQRLSDETATLTAVKVGLVVVANAPTNECEHRHTYGVRELVTPILTPCVEASWIFSFDANSDDSGKCCGPCATSILRRSRR